MKAPKNSNYAGVVVKITNIFPLENCDNVQGTNIFGNSIVIGKDVNVGDVGIYFPVETQLSNEYLRNNNLYRNKDMNVNPEKAGYFEQNGRIKCMKFRGNKSMGLFMPLESLSFIPKFNIVSLKEGDIFDELEGVEICKKYVIYTKTQNPSKAKGKVAKKISKLIDNQFRFHIDTEQLGRNINKVKPTDTISITSKWHGTSCISSKILCRKKLSIWDKIGKLLGFNVVETHYDYIYSSRKVIKNAYENENKTHFYDVDVWGLANEVVKPFLKEGMTMYYEIVGYLPSGKMIQKDYDYGCEVGKFDIMIYRITTTTPNGDVVEWSAKMVQQYCKSVGLKPVIEYYYGVAKDLFPEIAVDENWNDNFLSALQKKYLEKKCEYCKNDVPDEGIVLRREVLDIDVYKLKSFAFLKKESDDLDKGTEDIESKESVEEN